jgi:hypothetical protein
MTFPFDNCLCGFDVAPPHRRGACRYNRDSKRCLNAGHCASSMEGLYFPVMCKERGTGLTRPARPSGESREVASNEAGYLGGANLVVVARDQGAETPDALRDCAWR